MDDENDDSVMTTRAPTDVDLAHLAERLNELGAKYIVVGGIAVISRDLRRGSGV